MRPAQRSRAAAVRPGKGHNDQSEYGFVPRSTSLIKYMACPHRNFFGCAWTIKGKRKARRVQPFRWRRATLTANGLQGSVLRLDWASDAMFTAGAAANV